MDLSSTILLSRKRVDNMTAPKQPNLTTEEKELVVYLLDQEYDQVNANIRGLDRQKNRTSLNAHKLYKKQLAKTLNKIPNKRYSYDTTLR